MRFLVIGASGFIGRHVLAQARARGFEAVGTQARSRQAGLVRFDLERDRIADCVDRRFLEREGPWCAIVSAVVSDMERCLTDREASRRINVEQTIRLIEDLRGLGARPVFFSTGHVFDGSVGYYTEDHPYSPANEYARHKVEVEQYLRAHVPAALITRFDKVLGSDPRERHLLSEMYQLIQQDQPVVCVAGMWISPTLVQDVARAVVLGCERGLSGIYHLANCEYFTREELARQFCHALGRPANVVCKPLRDFGFKDNRALKSYLDGGKFVRATGFRYTTMREVFDAFIQQLPVCRPS